MYWMVEGKNKVQVYGVEYTDDGKPLRRIGPVWKRIRMYGMIAKLLRREQANRPVFISRDGFDRSGPGPNAPKRKQLLEPRVRPKMTALETARWLREQAEKKGKPWPLA